jgi:hypothetical protein
VIGYLGPVTGYLGQRSELRDERAKLARLEERRDAFRAQLAALNEPAVLEARARELGMIEPGERAFVVTGALDPPPSERQDTGGDGGIFGWLPGV